MSNQVANYRRSQIEGADSSQILVLLMQTAVQRAHAAIRFCEPDKDTERGEAVRRLLDIVIELRSTLDKSAGEVASNLDALYDYVISEVIDAHSARDPEKFRQALEVLDVLRDAFTQAAEQVRSDPAAQQQMQAAASERQQQAATPVPPTPAPAPKVPVVAVGGSKRLTPANAPVAVRRYMAV